MVVFAFDRDWTVGVNPHPRREAVPLGWVRHLAHETDHAVYAIGNQALAEEAAIPGVVDVVGRHPDDWDDWLGKKRPDGRYEQFPSRRERLELIADLHPDADTFVVVDDLNLSDVDGWDHYHAWEFVPAIKRGDIDPALPWVKEPQADGGLRTIAQLDDPDPSALSAFLTEHPEVAGYELSFIEDGTARTEECYDLSVNQRSVERPSAVPVVWCTPTDPTRERFHVPIRAIDSVTAIGGSPPDLIHTDTEEPDTARALRRLASEHPGAVEVASLVSLIERGDEETQTEALRALASVAQVSPDESTAALPVLGSLLESETPSTSGPVLEAVRSIAEKRPADVAPFLDAIVPSLSADDDTERTEAARCVVEVADQDPADAVDAVPMLATIVEDGRAGQSHAVYALTCLSREYPEEIRPVAESLATAVTNDALDDGVRLNATAALGRVVGEYPSAAVTVVEDIVELLDSDTPELRNNVIALIGDVAQLHTDVVKPHVDAIADWVSSDDTYTRINASCCLARVAKDYPETVASHTETLLALLTDDNEAVRENACWALGHLAADEAEMALVERASQDDDEAVRKRASWALRRIQQ